VAEKSKTKKMRVDTSRLEPFGIEPPRAEDGWHLQYHTIVKVAPDETGWSVTTDDSTGFHIPYLPIQRYGTTLREAIVPEVGQDVTLATVALSTITGISVAGQVVFQRTRQQQEDNHRIWVMVHQAEQGRMFVLNKAKMDADYERLVPFFKERVDRFRAERGDEFRVDSEGYEVYILLQAQQIADWAREGDPEDPVEFLQQKRGANLPNDERMKVWGGLWDRLTESGVVDDGHSNNTFSGALRMAKALLQHERGEDVKV
jgi:hypothetical protein